MGQIFSISNSVSFSFKNEKFLPPKSFNTFSKLPPLILWYIFIKFSASALDSNSDLFEGIGAY